MNFNEMRENKFKCWDKKLNKWVDIFTHKIGVQLTDVGFAMSTGWDSEDNPTWDFSKVEFDRYEYPQFTGLLDKNGKEIYEGDILNIEDCELIIVNNHSPNGPDEKMIDSIVTVFYEGCSFCFTHPNSNTSCPIDYDEMGKIEVIGNLYENPELL